MKVKIGRKLSVGAKIWLPCEVKPGPFSDERLIKIPSVHGEWLGFVPASFLKEPIATGITLVGATVTEIHGERFQALLPGQAITPQFFEGTTSRAVKANALQAGPS